MKSRLGETVHPELISRSKLFLVFKLYIAINITAASNTKTYSETKALDVKSEMEEFRIISQTTMSIEVVCSGMVFVICGVKEFKGYQLCPYRLTLKINALSYNPFLFGVAEVEF